MNYMDIMVSCVFIGMLCDCVEGYGLSCKPDLVFYILG